MVSWLRYFSQQILPSLLLLPIRPADRLVQVCVRAERVRGSSGTVRPRLRAQWLRAFPAVLRVNLGYNAFGLWFWVLGLWTQRFGRIYRRPKTEGQRPCALRICFQIFFILG